MYEEVEFPAVSFCNLNPIRRSQLTLEENIDLTEVIESLDQATADQLSGVPQTDRRRRRRRRRRRSSGNDEESMVMPSDGDDDSFGSDRTTKSHSVVDDAAVDTTVPVERRVDLLTDPLCSLLPFPLLCPIAIF